jgi:hypothetical protein
MITDSEICSRLNGPPRLGCLTPECWHDRCHAWNGQPRDDRRSHRWQLVAARVS